MWRRKGEGDWKNQYEYNRDNTHCMRLIGIKLLTAEPVVKKSLYGNTWYPFGNYEEPDLSRRATLPREEPEIANLYQIDSKLPQITIQCIVGMNGCGKSTLIDVLLRVINNFAFVALKGWDRENRGRDLRFAYGLTADFYFETDGIIGCIHNGRNPKEMSVTYGWNNAGRRMVYDYYQLANPSFQIAKDILSHFFYTVCTNYSTYAFNENDYRKDVVTERGRQKSIVNGKWLSGLFHKNDGYQAPVVMTPYRKNFNIDINRETKLAMQRIITLTLMLYSQKERNENGEWEGKLLLQDMVPDELVYEFDTNYRATLLSKTEKLLGKEDINSKIRAEAMLQLFEAAWKEIFGTDLNAIESEEERNTAVRYLAYKTIKMGVGYDRFDKLFDFKKAWQRLSKQLRNQKEITEDDYQWFINEYVDYAENLVCAVRDDKSHISLKARQCLEFIKRGGNDGIKYIHLRDVMTVDEFLRGRVYDTYDEMFLALPPAFYKLDIWYRPKDKASQKAGLSLRCYGAPRTDHISLGQMSSGQKQWLNCLSYICYHAKNIESVKNDDTRIPYHHLNLIFDEAELYYHPEFQKSFVKRLLESIANCHLDKDEIKSINILIATHSPFILSDVLTQNSLYLKKGRVEYVEGQTFGANYYDLLHNSFFLEDRAIGDIAARRIGEWVGRMRNNENVDRLMPYVGDPMVKSYNDYLKEKR